MRNAHVRVLRTELATGYCTSACYQQKERPRILRVQVLYRQYWYTKPHTPLLFSSLISEEEAATAWVKNSEEKAFLARPAEVVSEGDTPPPAISHHEEGALSCRKSFSIIRHKGANIKMEVAQYTGAYVSKNVAIAVRVAYKTVNLVS